MVESFLNSRLGLSPEFTEEKIRREQSSESLTGHFRQCGHESFPFNTCKDTRHC